MCKKSYLIFILITVILLFANTSTAGNRMTGSENDTIRTAYITFTPEAASAFINDIVARQNLWRSEKDTLRISLQRLLQHFDESFDSVQERLNNFPFDSVIIKPTLVVHTDTIPLRWLSDVHFIADTIPLDKSPVFARQTLVVRTLEIDSATRQMLDSLPDLNAIVNSLIRIRDTVTEQIIDYPYLESKNLQVYQIKNGEVDPPLLPSQSRKTFEFTADSSSLVFFEKKLFNLADPESPFYAISGEMMIDSLKFAVATLLRCTYQRDSVLLYIKDISGKKTPFWLSARSKNLYRYWLKNSLNDSVTVWLGNPAKYDLSMFLEESVIVERQKIRPADDVPITTVQPERKLLAIRPLKEIPVFWDYSLMSSFSLNQNYLTYWAQGGESSFAGMIDIKGTAKYTNTEDKSSWTNQGRFRFGSVRTKERGNRINADIIELNSQYNRKLTNNLDFSSVFYIKTQVAKGYNYPNDSVVISRFLNPGTFTIGVGVEYKPIKNTVINFSPLSYKNTFVLDTANIDQTAHGVEKDKRSRQEVGGQLVLTNSVSVFEGAKISNALRLFSSYIEKPQNVDVDWEMNMEKQISWFFSVRLNVHLIYDDDMLFPIELPDGGERKAPRAQFNQFLGLSVSVNL